MRAGALNLLVFREARRSVCGPELKESLRQQLTEMESMGGAGKVLNALLRAGELECAVADDAIAPPRVYEDLTDHLAETLVAGRVDIDLRTLQQKLARAPVSEELSVATPEGFAYYALHPLAYAEVLEQMTFPRGLVAVVGIRSIGTTLSAVAAAAARARGLNARRITVRPGGHPYNRHTEFNAAQLQFIHKSVDSGAIFLIVDEGPGLSGSSFLSVAESLASAGVPAQRILLVCGREPHFDSFRTEDGPRRARRFRWIAVLSRPRHPAADLFVGGGAWRDHVLPERAQWPASWTTFERLKYLSPADEGPQRLFKFLGLGHYGEEVVAREQRVADAGFGLAVQAESEGFASYPWMAARPMRAADLSGPVLERLAAYCVFRSQALPGDAGLPDALQEMARHNLGELKVAAAVDLQLERPVLADGRMQPHEWLLDARGQMLKTDSGSHGDDHFFPGLTDIAWDLAGAIVDWRMNAAQVQAFLEEYRRRSGDDAKGRIDSFVVAYVVFRRAYCLMAANALQGSEEQSRLEAAAEGYEKVLDTLQSSSFANRR
jgi:hypothetical protein